MRRRVAAAGLALLAMLAIAAPAAAHPLGNATVNRAVAVVATGDGLRVTYLIDMAEIPAFSALLDMGGSNGSAPPMANQASWAEATCASARAGLSVTVDGGEVALVESEPPVLTFPPGVGGLETLRLECPLDADLGWASGDHVLGIVDAADAGYRGWREVTLAGGGGAAVVSSTVPAASPSAGLTAYPQDLLNAPQDVRSAEATIRVSAGLSGANPVSPFANLNPASPASDPLAGLLARGGSPLALLAAGLLAAGLGAAHAVSPGHGKALIAAYAIGSRGTLRRAAALGLTVAASHTFGVFVLGAVVLFASDLLVPERVVAWISAGSGILVVLVGASVAFRTIVARRSRRCAHDHGQGHDHGRPRGHHHPHPHGASDHRREPPVREVLTLGLVGGMVPSASALIVLLVAITTGRLVEGLALIAAFGFGMAAVLASLAAATSLARDRAFPRLAAEPRLRRLAAAAPIASAAIIMAAGAVATIGAIGSL